MKNDDDPLHDDSFETLAALAVAALAALLAIAIAIYWSVI